MAKKSGELTPLMKQYWDIKTFHQDKILLFRMGDFYEMFYDDAVKAAPILGIALTQRNKKSEDQTPMCGVPHHSIAGPINKLLASGLKIAICDQVEDPKLAKGIVKRAVTRVLTPGMVYDSETLDQTKAHYLASIDTQEISFIDTTTGECFYFKSDVLNEKLKLLEILPVVEVVLPDITEDWIIENKLNDRFVVSEHKVNCESSHHLLLDYIQKLSNQEILQILKPFVEKEFEHRLVISSTVLRHLEIFSTYKGELLGSLYHAINRTKTSAGARLLRQFISFPLRNKKSIEHRYSQIESFRQNMFELKKVRETLSQMGDIERRLGKIAQPQCHGRDLIALSQAMQAGLQALKWCHQFFPFKDEKTITTANNLIEKIDTRISEEAPLTIKQGYIIKKGFSPELDELIDLSTNAIGLLQKMEAEEKEKTGISSLKIRYNNVFGYYIEVTNTHKDKVPSRYQRKQTLANAERFYTDELMELEKKVLTAQTKRFDLEFALFDELRKLVLATSSEILKLAAICSELDVISSLAWLSLEESYCRPQITDDRVLSIKSSRHPVVEQFMRGQFIANDIRLGLQDCLMITGPNMAGKSTLMRQVALTVLMAQMGSYVPAESASLPLYDALFTRIGAGDQLSEGLSTFMVEMTETALMLKSATSNSLLILDEVGRGTATFDGMCLAQSILEYILETLKAQVLFATHYHELTDLDQKFSNIKNYHMKVHDHKDGHIEFLHLLVTGPAGKSYGVKVAELAGLPITITKRAAELLVKYESAERELILKEIDGSSLQLDPQPSSQLNLQSNLKKPTETQNQMNFFDSVKSLTPEQEQFIQELKQMSISQTSPLQALNKLAEWQERLN